MTATIKAKHELSRTFGALAEALHVARMNADDEQRISDALHRHHVAVHNAISGRPKRSRVKRVAETRP